MNHVVQEIEEALKSKQINWIISKCCLILCYCKHSVVIFGEQLQQDLQIICQRLVSFPRPLGCLITGFIIP